MKREKSKWWDLVSYPSSRFCFLLWRARLRTAVWAWRLSAAIGPSPPRTPSRGPAAWCRRPCLPMHTPFHLQRDKQKRHCVSTAFKELFIIYPRGATTDICSQARWQVDVRWTKEKCCQHLSKMTTHRDASRWPFDPPFQVCNIYARVRVNFQMTLEWLFHKDTRKHAAAVSLEYTKKRGERERKSAEHGAPAKNAGGRENQGEGERSGEEERK